MLKTASLGKRFFYTIILPLGKHLNDSLCILHYNLRTLIGLMLF